VDDGDGASIRRPHPGGSCATITASCWALRRARYARCCLFTRVPWRWYSCPREVRARGASGVHRVVALAGVHAGRAHLCLAARRRPCLAAWEYPTRSWRRRWPARRILRRCSICPAVFAMCLAGHDAAQHGSCCAACRATRADSPTPALKFASALPAPRRAPDL